MRGKVHEPPKSPDRPAVRKPPLNNAFSEAIRISQACVRSVCVISYTRKRKKKLELTRTHAQLKPAPAQAPFTAAMDTKCEL